MMLPWMLLLFVGLASAVPYFTNSDWDIQVGEPFTIRWQGALGLVKLRLGKGSNYDDVREFRDIASKLDAISYEWTPDPRLESGNYTFLLEDAQYAVYSQPWELQGVQSKISDPPPTEETPTPKSSGLSNMDKTAIIAVGTVLGIGLLVAAGLYIYKRGRQSVKTVQHVTSLTPTTLEEGYHKPELSTDPFIVQTHLKHELDGDKGCHELPAERGCHEMDTAKSEQEPVSPIGDEKNGKKEESTVSVRNLKEEGP